MRHKDRRPRLDPGIRLELAGISRRDFIRYCGGLAAALGLAGCDGDKTRQTLEDAGNHTVDGKPPVLWLNGQDCNGCSISFLGLAEDADRGIPSMASVLLDTISLRYHEAVMASAGHLAEETKAAVIADGGYILVVEGAIPSADDRYCMIGGVPFRETLLEAAANADHIIAIGSCATGGGVARLTPSAGRPVSDFVTDTTVINLPMCPVDCEQLLLTIVHLLTEGQPPALDSRGRPAQFFTGWVHDDCSRRAAFEAGNFLTDWNDPSQKDWCLHLRGCRGPTTRSSCSVSGVDGTQSCCTAAGAPCQGCATHLYYDGTPLYAPLG